MTTITWPAGVSLDRREAIATIVHLIAEHQPIVDDSGRATAVLGEIVQEAGVEVPGTLSKLLSDLDGGRFGKVIQRDMSGKRTFAIEIAPTVTLLPDPRNPDKIVSAPVEDDPETDQDEIDALIAAVPDGPGTALEPVEDVSRVDKLLYIISMLNELVTEEVNAPKTQFDLLLESRLTAVNSMLEENVQLKTENENLRSDKRKLAAALNAANVTLRNRANGVSGHASA